MKKMRSFCAIVYIRNVGLQAVRNAVTVDVIASRLLGNKKEE